MHVSIGTNATRNRTHGVDSEHLRVKDAVPELGIVGGGCADGGLAELVFGDFEGNVGTTESAARNAEFALDHVRVAEGEGGVLSADGHTIRQKAKTHGLMLVPLASEVTSTPLMAEMARAPFLMTPGCLSSFKTSSKN